MAKHPLKEHVNEPEMGAYSRATAKSSGKPLRMSVRLIEIMNGNA